MSLTVAELAERLGAELAGDGSVRVCAVGPVEAAGESDVTFAKDSGHISRLKSSRAAAVIAAGHIEDWAGPQLIVKNVDAALIEALNIFAPPMELPAVGVDPTAKVSSRAKVGKNVHIGACAVIDDGAEIGDNSVIGAGCKIGRDSKLGKNCRLDGNVVVYHNCRLGNNVIIQANSTIGSTGFGYSFIDGSHKLIPHNGIVVIEDFVEIGANCCVDRAKFSETRIGAGTKIDNLVQIAHNVVIGKCCLIAGQVGVSGSCKIGDGVVMGGQSGVADNIEIGNGTMVGAQSGVTHNIAAKQQIFGMPATDIKEAFKIIGLTRRLPKLVEQLKQLSARIEKLEAAKDDKE